MQKMKQKVNICPKKIIYVYNSFKYYKFYNKCLASKLVEINVNVKNIFLDIEEFKQRRIKIKTDPENFNIIKEHFTKLKDVTLIDGIKITPKEDKWVLIRPSNTEKCIRISAEAKSKNDVNKLIKKYEQTIKKILN